MSNSYTHAIRPKGVKFEKVAMLDNYYGEHNYGVQFPDGKVYPAEKCKFN